MSFFKGDNLPKAKVKKSEDNFKDLLYWKKEYRKILKLKDDPNTEVSEEEIKRREKYITQQLAKKEDSMIDISKGLYMGTAYELNKEQNPEPIPLYARWNNLNNHLGVKGTTRVGKTITMLGHIEQCIAKGWDVIIIDPKGGEKQEVLSSVAESCFKYKRADEMSYYSPAFSEISEKMNLLYGMSNIQIASTIMNSIKTPTVEDFYIEVGTRLLLAITTGFEYLQAVSDPDGKITQYLEEQELERYLQLRKESVKQDSYGLANEDKIEDFISFKSSTQKSEKIKELVDIGFNRTLITYRDLERYCHFQELSNLKKIVDNIPFDANNKKLQRLKREAMATLNSALSTKEEHFSKVSDSLSNRLLQLSIGEMGELLCDIRINPLLAKLRNPNKGVVSVIQPFPMIYKNTSTMLNKMVLGMLDSLMGVVGASGRPLPRRVAIFIDEFGSIAYPGIQDFFNRAGGLGITVFAYTQSDEDYKEAVGETIANIILDNVNTPITMQLNLKASAEKAADDIGMVKVHKTISMIGSSGDGRYATDITDEYLCSPDDIKRLPNAEGIIRHNKKVYYIEFPFRPKPAGSIIMPELQSETRINQLYKFESVNEDLEVMEVENGLRKEAA